MEPIARGVGDSGMLTCHKVSAHGAGERSHYHSLALVSVSLQQIPRQPCTRHLPLAIHKQSPLTPARGDNLTDDQPSHGQNGDM
ncbi:hypothetical protein BaRGS_00013475 [Batillaria attramentaria]|uniref:Uncharacterized protein n=1 Tax=Batillaria attramentaria TaxID=370345 RepID=A0ABD0L740_9CAEN